MIPISLLIISQPVNGDRELDKLIDKTAKNDKVSFENLYFKTNVAVYSFVLSILKNPKDAEDVTQDVYLAIYESSKNYVSKNKPMAWIMTIAKNLSYRKLNQNKKETKFNENIVDYSSIIAVEDKLLLNQYLCELSDEERQIIILHIVAGFKHREISALLDIPFSTVRSKYSRAVNKLEKALKEGGTFND